MTQSTVKQAPNQHTEWSYNFPTFEMINTSLEYIRGSIQSVFFMQTFEFDVI